MKFALDVKSVLEQRQVWFRSKYSEKYIWLLIFILFYSFQCWWQVLQTSTDPHQQCSAPFKARDSRQVQTCYKTNNSNTKETATFSSLHRYMKNRSSHDLESLSVNLTALTALRAQAFSFLTLHKLWHFCPRRVKQCHYHKKTIGRKLQQHQMGPFWLKV